MNKASKQANMSTKSSKDQSESHNLGVPRSAFCPTCRLVTGRLEAKKAERA